VAKVATGAWRELFAGLMVAMAVWLAGQALRLALDARLPPKVALHLAPGSPDVLARAAEADLIDGQRDAAAMLARASLARSPFNVQALRVLGLAVADRDVGAADRVLTLAGDWSLRDDPTQAWLMNRRLAQGDIAGMVRRADLLARRREDLHPKLFAIFDAVGADPAGAALVAARLESSPQWRPSYIEALAQTESGEVIGSNLALAMQRTASPMSDHELSVVYGRLHRLGDFDALRRLRAVLKRPPPALLADGDFPRSPTGPEPLTFTYRSESGFEAATAPAPDKPEGGGALRLSFDGFTPGIAASQLILAAPGAYRLSGRSRWETQATAQPPVWAVVCAVSGARVAQATPAGQSSVWSAFQGDFVVPAEGCPAQIVILQTTAGDRRTDAVIWFDDLKITAR
jgi:hypothetical protein